MAGMGELHLEIYVERIRREYDVEVEVGAPKVNYREAPTQAGRVQHPAPQADRRFGPVRPHRRPAGRRCRRTPPETFVFEEEVVGGRIPKQFIPAVEKGFRQMVHKGPDRRVSGGRPGGVPGRRLLSRGRQLRHGVPDLRRTAMRETFPTTRPVLLEPVMKIEIECPSQFQGSVVGNLTSRRGMVVATEVSGATAGSRAKCPWPRPSAIRPTCGA